MARYAVAIVYEKHDQGRSTYKMRQAIIQARGQAEALGVFIVEDNPKNYGSVGLWAVNLIDDKVESKTNKVEKPK